ncbi:MAG TPA: hypothetical protein VEQ58_05485 [Polyangiaceae bacterium]|nr:hypothetical protein [Polyangiaceae bacterium]
MSERLALEEQLRREPDNISVWQAYGKQLALLGDRGAELIELELRCRAKEDSAYRARHDARDALRAKLALREADGVDGEFQWTRFKVWRVRRDHAAVLARLGEYSLLDASDLELAELSGASLASCLDSLAYLRPRQLRRWLGAAPGARWLSSRSATTTSRSALVCRRCSTTR